MDYSITIDNFSGPLDLLLHLIKQSNISIYDIKIEEITNQYLKYIEEMKNLNLNIASSYLVMASELIEIKASMLLPKPQIEEDEYEESPQDRLIKKLVEYQNYKEIIENFKKLEKQRQEYYTKKSSDISEYVVNNKITENISLEDFINVFKNFLINQEQTKPLNTKITTKEYSISKRSIEIKNILKEKGEINFKELFQIKSKPYIIVSFLAILSLAKDNNLIILQNNNFDEIKLCEVNK